MTIVGPPGASSPNAPPAQPATGEHVQSLLASGLDRYDLTRLLGVGGMGEVYLGVHRTIEKEVAIKVLAYQHRNNPNLNERFLEEAKAASKIRHDNIVDITDFGHSPQGCAYFVMEYLQGEDLAATLRRERPLPWARTQHILLQVLGALKAAHERGIVHRDIKPANCLRTTKHGDSDFIKVLDFGIARVDHEGEEPAERLTKAGTIMGTAEYMAPEQARGEEVDPRTDLYAVGIMLYQMVTGRLPFRAKAATEVLAMQLYSPPAPPSAVAPEPLPDGLEALILRAMAKERDERFASADEFAAAIAAIPAAGISPVGATAVATPGMMPPAAMTPPGGMSAPPITGPVGGMSAPPITGPVGGMSAPPITGPGGATNPVAPNTGIPTGAIAAPPASSSKAPLLVAGIVGMLAAGGIGYWLTQGGDEASPADAPAASAAAETKTEGTPADAKGAPDATPEGAAAAGPGCPDGMVLIEGGSFFMGTDNETVPALQAARPTHKVRVESYCIAVDEVTVDQFHACSEKGECRRAFKDAWWPQGSSDEESWAFSRDKLGALCNERHQDHGAHPINCITWAQARDYCQFRGQRLPTEAEWEFAARGSDGRVFPWGDEPPTHEHGNLCNAECVGWRIAQGLPLEGKLSDADDTWPGTAPVGSFGKGTTQHGLRDMVGNVFEWTASDFTLYEGHPDGVPAREGKVIRGGAFNSAVAMFADPALRFPSDPKSHTHGIGFRCAADPEAP